MKKSKCFVCRKRSKWFYENVFFLRTKYSERTIAAVMKIVLGEASALICINPAVMCFKCVDLINEYDEAYKKMQVMEVELKSMIDVNMIAIPKQEDADDHTTPTDDVTNDANDIDATKMDVDSNDVGDSISITSNGAVDIESLKLPENNEEDPNVTQKPIEEDIVENVPSKKKKKSKYYCKPCNKSFKGKRGLQIHIFHFHIKTERYECPACDKVYRRPNHLEVNEHV